MASGSGVKGITAFRLARFRGWTLCLAIVFSLRLGAYCASGPRECVPYASLWWRADSALYAARRGSRDRIAQEEGLVCEPA